jgi:hypothetical protein
MPSEAAVTSTSDLLRLYAKHIKPLPVADQLQLLAVIAGGLSSDLTSPPAQERSLLELEGLGAEIWQGVDAQEYVNGLRSEWDARP